MTFQRTSEQESDGAKGLKREKIGKGALLTCAVLLVYALGVIHQNSGFQHDYSVSITRSDAQLSAHSVSDSASHQTKQEPAGNIINLASDSSPRISVQNALDARLICLERIRNRQWESLSPFFAEIRSSEGVSEANPLLLIDPAYHPNFGDTLLNYGEYAFFQRLWDDLKGPRNGDKLVLHECNYLQAKPAGIVRCGTYLRYRLWSNFTGKRFGVWHAGGNWGDLYGQIQQKRLSSFETLLNKNFSVLGMPQSLFYKNQDREIEQAERLRRSVFNGLQTTFYKMGYNYSDPATDTYDKEVPDYNASNRAVHPLDTPEGRTLARSRVVLTWREEGSYKKALERYPFVTNLLVPDIAFQTGPFWNYAFYDPQFEKNTVDVLFLLRDDGESRFKSIRRNDAALSRLLNNHNDDSKNLTHRVVDWRSRSHLFGNDDYLNTTTAVELLKLGRVLICDRLHASILAYLSGVPFVYLDQVSNKVTNVLNVAFAPYETGSDADGHDCMDGQKHMWAKATSIEEAVVKARQMLKDYKMREGKGAH